MLKLEANDSDDPAFLDLASRLIAGAALASGLGDLVVVRTDHWFGERWLTFRGKVLGAAGVRNRRLTDELTPPPFHPHRVQSVRAYRLEESQDFEYRDDVRWLHGFQTSEANMRRTLRRDRLYAWYSGDTAQTDKGVVMVYAVEKVENAAWYTAFHKASGWHLAQTVGIAPQKVHEFVKRAAPEQRHA